MGVELFPRTDRLDDASLVAGLALGDEQAALAFVRRFQDAVFGLALSVTRDRALAEDVSQEVFVRAWRAAGNYDPRRASALTWLLTITRNAAIDAVRARRPTPVLAETLERLLDVTLRSAADTDDTERLALLTLESERALARLQALPEEQARAVALAVLGGCTAAEVGRHENIPLGTAKTRIRTGLRRLRDTLKEESRDGTPPRRATPP
ncbi:MULTISPECIES: RNA polymerase sigma factor [Streptomyces]|jgi:RNA polymerase sigma-70 factor (ECF subfamily)|uniref:Sigma-70 family RNA polymerase sigma factor n=1 Tax=Streptomyces spinosisporus TaxID=2927582 RepID=A0ABS9XKW4_9ACTN|nr:MULTISPECIES: sigma-70 family RNA polymerase sigma factor [Streptomyces]MCI3242705.1 sigma-70 family RNA polymerase sigma factor [Streptomyces spinosisporus]WUB40083.1 sigma-70 family RNA polymerase sigma factor [Streptomyces sp. NBC_00588]